MIAPKEGDYLLFNDGYIAPCSGIGVAGLPAREVAILPYSLKSVSEIREILDPELGKLLFEKLYKIK